MTHPPAIPIRSMRRIDQYAGPPLCMALAALKWLGRRLHTRPPEAPPTFKKVLVIKMWGMGSIVLTTPALRALKKLYPSCAVTFLTFEQNESVCRMIQSIDRVYPYRASSAGAFAASLFRLLRFLWRERFDVVIDLEFFANFTSVITACAAAPVTVGFHTPKFWRESFYTRRVSFDHSRHITEIFLKAIGTLGGEADGLHLDALQVHDAAAESSLARLLEEKSVAPGEPLVCININASPLDFKRRWPLESYADLVARILASFPDHKIVLLGSHEERSYVAGLTRSLPADARLIDLSGKIGLPELVLLLRRSRLFIGNDSGPLHLAVACGAPTVSFFGPETPALYGPRGAGHSILYENIACSPCLNAYSSKDNTSCRNNVCMKSIRVDDAWSAVEAKLGGSSDLLYAERAGGVR